jgi:cytochrome c oxidase subunit 2
MAEDQTQETSQAEAHETAVGRRQLGQMLLIGLIASIIGVAVALLIDWFPVQASSQAHQIDTLYDVLLIVSVPVFVLVEVVVLFSVWKFRMRPGEELKDGPPIHGNTRLEIIWTAIPAILLVGLCAYAYAVLHDVEKAQANTMKVTVTGEQFAWTFSYPAQGGGKPVTSTQLYLPKGRPVEFDIKAKDVIHSFFVPAFRIKQDAVPGITTHTRATPNRLGAYPVVCAELCGIGHAVMRQTAHVVAPAAFQKWLSAQGKPAVAPGASPGQSANAGKQLFTSADNACSSCHTLGDAGASGKIGPNLDKVLKGKDKSFIHTSIVDPNAFVEKGFQKGIMPPTFGKTLSKQEIGALVDYLSKVTQ